MIRSWVMAIVTIMCPRTGTQVSTGVEMDQRAFNALRHERHFSSRCWHCGGEHEWSRRWAILIEEHDLVFADPTPQR
jgi:hypothetical protein